MARNLARRFQLEVAPYNSALALANVTGWTQFKGVNDFDPGVTPTLQSVDDYDTNGWSSSEKTMQAWEWTAKATRPGVGTVQDPGQEIVRLSSYGFQDSARVFARYWDKNGLPEAFAGVALTTWDYTKTGVADVHEVTAKFTGDGALVPITNPYTTASAPVIAAVSPAGQGTGQAVVIYGSGFTSTVAGTGVKFGGTQATSFNVINDGQIVAVLPTGAAGAATVVVTNAVGASQAFTYTRAA